MKLKFGRILLLSLFLFLLPLSVFARSSPKEETIAQKNDTVVEEKAPVEKELAKETEASGPVNIRKIVGGGTTEEPVDKPQEKEAQEEITQTETTTKAETVATEETEKPLEKIEEGSKEIEKPEVGDPLVSDSVTGGGSGCGGGSSGGSGSGYVSTYEGGTIIIEKVDENGKPMGVAFKVTNLETGETHIVVTNKDGKSGEIHLAPGTFLPPPNGDFEQLSREEIEKLIQLIEEKGFPVENEKDSKNPDIFKKEGKGGPVEPPIPPGGNPIPPEGDGGIPVDPEEPEEPKGEVNQNDKYLVEKDDKYVVEKDDKYEVKGLYKYEDLTPGGVVKFKKRYNSQKKGTIRLVVNYGRPLPPSKPPVDGQIPPPQPQYEKTETYTYEDKTFEDYNKIDHRKVAQFAIARLAILVKEGKVKPEDLNNVNWSLVFEDKRAIYKFEELRTDTNKNYSLKTFYIQDSQNGPILMGDSEDKIDTPATRLEYPKLPEGPIAPDNPQPQPQPNPDTDVDVVPPKADLDVSGPKEDTTGPDVDISGPMIPAPVRGGSSGGGGGGSSVGGSGSGKGVPIITRPTFIFKVTNEKFVFETLATNKETGEKTVKRGTSTTVEDKITFDKLSPKKAYKFVGKLIHKKTGQVVKTVEYETGKLAKADGEARLEFTFDSSKYAVGDEFVIVYDIYEDGQLAGEESDRNNKAQSFTIKDGTTPPPEEETPPPKEETPPPKEETPPPKEETPPLKEETPPPKVPEKLTKRPPFEAPKTFDPGIGFSLMSAITSGMALTFLKKRR